MADVVDKPAGRDAVMDVLVDATGQLILERGVTMSVRDIARRAGVNHGLVHTYFGSKEALLSAAFGHLVDRAAAELDDDGFRPADPRLPQRRGGDSMPGRCSTWRTTRTEAHPTPALLASSARHELS